MFRIPGYRYTLYFIVTDKKPRGTDGRLIRHPPACAIPISTTVRIFEPVPSQLLLLLHSDP